MTAKYYAILTNQGAARLANATALGTKLNLTQMAVGDAKGTLPAPDPSQTALINQKRIAPINLLTIDPANPSQIIIEQIIPEDEGGWWIREIGLYDSDGVLIAVANCPETYKPQLQEGSGRTQTIRMILIVSNTAAVTLKIDPSVVLATRKYVDDKAIEVRQYAADLMKNHLADTDPHKQYLRADKNLSDLKDKEAARSSLGLKGAAQLDVGKEQNTVAAGDDSRIVNALQVTKRPLAVDLNTLGQPEHIGIYCQDYDKNAKAEFHYPVQLSGTLTVTPTAYGCVQEYTTYSQSRKFIRGLVGAWNGSGPWAEWAEVYSTNRKPTPAEIGALSTAGGTAAYIDDALNFNVKGTEWKGAGAFAEQYKNAAAPFMKKYGYAALKGASQYHPIIKGIIYTDTYGYGTAVSLGMLTYGDARFAQGIIQVIGDNGVSREWSFDPATGNFTAPGVMSPGSYSNFDARYVLKDGVNWVGLIGGNESAPYIRSIATNNIIQLARTDWVINNYSSTAWVRQNFVSDVSLGAEGSFIIVKNAWQRVPGGCVLTGYNAEGDEPVNDTFFYRPIQKYYPAIGWMTVGHTA